MQRNQPLLLAALALSAACACSGKEEDPSDLRAEVADLRAEQRAMRQEIRELRESLPKSTEAAASPDDLEPPAAAGDQPPAAPATAPPASTAAADPKEPAAPPGKPGKPPAQGSVNIQVESNPAGAAVFVADKKVGLTPIVIKTPVGSSEISVRLEKSGYRPRLMTLRPEEDTKISVQLAKKSD